MHILGRLVVTQKGQCSLLAKDGVGCGEFVDSDCVVVALDDVVCCEVVALVESNNQERKYIKLHGKILSSKPLLFSLLNNMKLY